MPLSLALHFPFLERDSVSALWNRTITAASKWLKGNSAPQLKRTNQVQHREMPVLVIQRPKSELIFKETERILIQENSPEFV